MAKFMLILREEPAAFVGMSPDEMQAIIAEYGAWAGKLGQAGKLLGGNKLHDEGGRHMTARGGTLVTIDGPYAEAKEVVGGYFTIDAADYAEAEALAADCPHAKYGIIELRRVDEMEG